MSQIAQLSEAEIEERFHIVSRTAIQFMLAGFARNDESFSVHLHPGEDRFMTTLLAVQADKGRLIFDCSGSQETNRKFLDCDESTVVGRPGGIQVHFTIGPAVEVIYAGVKAFSVALPKVVVRLQRRENFRIETPRARPLDFIIRLPGGSLLTLPANNISVCGMGLSTTFLPDTLVNGLVLANCRFALPDEVNPVFLATTVRHLTELAPRAGQAQWRIGVQFNDLPAAEENRLQRYIARVEHERRELL